MGINYDFVQTIVESVTAAGSFFCCLCRIVDST